MIGGVGALAHESWRDADLALARAFSECTRARRALAAYPPMTKSGKPALAAEEAMMLALQELETALRLRGLVAFGKIGSVTAYDPALHALERGQAGAGAIVRFSAPGVMGAGIMGAGIMGAAGGVLLRACVRQVMSRKVLGAP